MLTDNQNNEKKTPDYPATNQQNQIAEGTVIEGNVTTNSSIRIGGQVEGSVKSPAKIIVGKKGLINGSLDCEKAEIEGKVNGDMSVSDTLTLRETAQIEGEVTVGKLAVDPGATFNATCVMKGSIKTMPVRDETKVEPAKDKKEHNHTFKSAAASKAK